MANPHPWRALISSLIARQLPFDFPVNCETSSAERGGRNFLIQIIKLETADNTCWIDLPEPSPAATWPIKMANDDEGN
jgi:hypothetical protein